VTSIVVNDLRVSYGGADVLADLSLEIADGEFFPLLGPSGCGKTTLLRTICGFITPSAGTIRFGDTDVTRVPTHRRDIGMVFQDYALFPDRSVFANVAFGLRARRVPAAELKTRVHEALERVGMSGYADRSPDALSGGQRQRVALARALVIRPKVLLMDEPLSNLDSKLRVQVREAIGDLQRELGITTVFVTHDQEEALALSDRIAVFRAGAIEQMGTPSEIYRSPRSTYTADFIGAANILEVRLPDDREHQAGEQVEFSLGDVTLTGITQTPVSAAEAYAVVRPESLSLADEAGTSTPGISGRVVRHQYLGSRVMHTVELSTGALVEVSEAATAATRSEGSPVRVVFPRDETLVLAS